MRYTEIPGWFDFHDLYYDVVAGAPDPAGFVEVGSLLGRSTAYLAELVGRSGKHIGVDAVDLWRVEYMEEAVLEDWRIPIGETDEEFRTRFAENMRACGVDGVVRQVVGDGIDSAGHYADGSLWFVFLDFTTIREQEILGIRAWLPKVAEGGILAGHDFGHQDVKQAVLEIFTDPRLRIEGNTWIYHNRKEP